LDLIEIEASAAVISAMFLRNLFDRVTGKELALKGGLSTARLVRVGDTVRRPVTERSALAHDLLRHLEQPNWRRKANDALPQLARELRDPRFTIHLLFVGAVRLSYRADFLIEVHQLVAARDSGAARRPGWACGCRTERSRRTAPNSRWRRAAPWHPPVQPYR
jgi:hypothetical protein